MRYSFSLTVEENIGVLRVVLGREDISGWIKEDGGGDTEEDVICFMFARV
jgi:hypothetical protein